jgi:hypothetical protein
MTEAELQPRNLIIGRRHKNVWECSLANRLDSSPSSKHIISRVPVFKEIKKYLAYTRDSIDKEAKLSPHRA